MESVREYKCLSCGAPIYFEPTLQKWKCNYCQSIYTKKELDEYYSQKEQRAAERAMSSGTPLPNEEPIVELDSYHCKNCGAEIVGDHETIATFCLYCKSPAIIKARMQGEFNPRYVIPFKFTQDQAQKLYAKWIKKHLLAPKQFKDDEEIEKIRGVYAPFWLYSCEGSQVYLKGVGENIKVWRAGDVEYTETSSFSVIRQGQISYENLPVDASSKMEDKAMEAIEPFNYDEMVDFSMDYMSGFFAERFDESKEQLEVRAKKRMDIYSKERINRTVSRYNHFRPEIENVEHGKIRADYSLLPVYILTNIYEGKAMQYVVNGQTGKIYGEVPISKVRLGAVFGGTFLTVWLLASILGMLLF